MGDIRDTIDGAFRDYTTEGVPASGAHEPVKSEIRAVGPILETAIGNAALGALVTVTKTTKALLDADLAHLANTVALVYADATAANNDLYVKSGGSGAGAWTNTGALQGSIASAAQLFVDDAEAAADLAEAWAEGTEPGGAGTKSAKEWADEVAASLEAADTRTKVLFDAPAVNSFEDLIYTPAAGLTVTPTEAALAAGSPGDYPLAIPSSDGVTPLNFSFDRFKFRASFEVGDLGGLDVLAAQVGGRFYIPATSDGIWGIQIRSHGGVAGSFLVSAIANGSLLAYIGNAAWPATVDVEFSHNLTDLSVRTAISINGGAETVVTTPYGPTGSSTEPTTRALIPTLRLFRGDITATSLTLSADNAGARFGFLGDSITIWPETGFAHLIREHFDPSPVLIAGASGAGVADWATMKEGFSRMVPERAFVLLPVNDIINGTPLATIQPVYQAILEELRDYGITPVIISTLPNGFAATVTFNTWAAGLGYEFIDVYPDFLGAGSSMDTDYTLDGIHLNDAANAGNELMKTLLLREIAMRKL